MQESRNATEKPQEFVERLEAALELAAQRVALRILDQRRLAQIQTSAPLFSSSSDSPDSHEQT